MVQVKMRFTQFFYKFGKICRKLRQLKKSKSCRTARRCVHFLTWIFPMVSVHSVVCCFVTSRSDVGWHLTVRHWWRIHYVPPKCSCPPTKLQLFITQNIRIWISEGCLINLWKPTGYVMHHQFNIQQLYVLPTLYLCVLYLSQDKQRLVPLTA